MVSCFGSQHSRCNGGESARYVAHGDATAHNWHLIYIQPTPLPTDLLTAAGRLNEVCGDAAAVPAAACCCPKTNQHVQAVPLPCAALDVQRLAENQSALQWRIVLG